MQLGKTTLLSLADELFSVNKTSNVDGDLWYSPGEADRNKWFVLRLDLSVVSAEIEDDEKATWEDGCRSIDKATASAIKHKVIYLLLTNKQLDENYERVFMGVTILDQPIGTVIDNQRTTVQLSQARLLILVDEYDQPVRKGLLHLIPDHSRVLYETGVKTIESLFGSFFAFFSAVKVALEQLDCAKLILTGITPIGIKEMTDLPSKRSLAFRNSSNMVWLEQEHPFATEATMGRHPQWLEFQNWRKQRDWKRWRYAH